MDVANPRLRSGWPRRLRARHRASHLVGVVPDRITDQRAFSRLLNARTSTAARLYRPRLRVADRASAQRLSLEA